MYYLKLSKPMPLLRISQLREAFNRAIIARLYSASDHVCRLRRREKPACIFKQKVYVCVYGYVHIINANTLD